MLILVETFFLIIVAIFFIQIVFTGIAFLFSSFKDFIDRMPHHREDDWL